MVGGFYTMHHWHPDIELTEISPEQTSTRQLRRLLTFPGQPKTTEELVMMDNANYHYQYKWHAGAWGERVKDYVAHIRVFDLDTNDRCMIQWSCHFSYFEDALSQFYWNGFHALQKMFPLNAEEAASDG